MKNFEVICTNHFGILDQSKRVKHVCEQSIYTVVREEKLSDNQKVYVIKIDPVNERKFIAKRFDKLVKGYNKSYEKMYYGRPNAKSFAAYLGTTFEGYENDRYFVYYTTEQLYAAYKKHGLNYPDYLKKQKKTYEN